MFRLAVADDVQRDLPSARCCGSHQSGRGLALSDGLHACGVAYTTEGLHLLDVPLHTHAFH